MQPLHNITKSGLFDRPSELDLENNNSHVDWARSFHGLSAEPFSKEAAAVLLEPISMEDVEIKPDGIVYMPEIKFRRVLNRAFGPGGWGLAPRSESIVTAKSVTREYALVAHGRYDCFPFSLTLYQSTPGVIRPLFTPKFQPQLAEDQRCRICQINYPTKKLFSELAF